ETGTLSHQDLETKVGEARRQAALEHLGATTEALKQRLEGLSQGTLDQLVHAFDAGEKFLSLDRAITVAGERAARADALDRLGVSPDPRERQLFEALRPSEIDVLRERLAAQGHDVNALPREEVVEHVRRVARDEDALAAGRAQWG